MKKALSVAATVAVTSAMLLSSCGAPSTAVTPPEELKILFIGNSFACDTIEYVADIAKDRGVKDITLGTLYIGGCSIKQHFQNAATDSATYEYFVNHGDGWSSTLGHSILQTVESDNWDVIAIQHGTADGSRYAEEESYEKLQTLIALVKSRAGDNTKIAFNMTWVGERNSHQEMINHGNDQLRYFRHVAEVTRDTVAPTEGLDILCPTGTAIQNARTADGLPSLNRDGYHLSFDLGRYIAGLTFFKSMTGVSVDDIGFAPEGVSDYEKQVAIEAANNAIATPYDVTACTVTVE